MPKEIAESLEHGKDIPMYDKEDKIYRTFVY